MKCLFIRKESPEFVYDLLLDMEVIPVIENPKEENLAPYLRQAHATFRNGFEDKELKQIFLRNTFEEISGREVRFSLDKSLSFCLEEMIKDLNVESVVKFLGILSKSLDDVAQSICGSRVLQTIFAKILKEMHESQKPLNAEIEKQLLEIMNVFRVDEKDFSEMVKNPNASHVFRSLYQMLGGMLLANSDIKTDIVLDKSITPKSFTKYLKAITTRIQEISRQQFIELLSDPRASPCIGVVLEVLNKRQLMKTLAKFCDTMLSHLNEDSMVIMMKDKLTSHVFEKVLQFGSKSAKKKMRKILMADEKVFFELGAHPVANFVVQRMITSAEDSEIFESIIQFVCKGFEDVLASQNFGVVQKLCEQCVKFPDFQRLFYDTLLNAFHCTDMEKRASFVSLLATMRTFDSFFDNNESGKIENVEYHGSVLLQTLLNFKNVGILVKSMSSIPVSNIVAMACNSSGSHFVDSFLASKKLKFKNKKEIIEKVGEEWCAISCDKYGSRVVEKLWNDFDIATKRLLIKFLVKKADDLSKNDFGKYVCRKVQMKRYQTRLEEWEMIQKQICNKRKLFADIIPGAAPTKKLKR